MEVVLALCENDLGRDSAFLEAFARATPNLNLKAIPLGGGVLGGKGARLLENEYGSFKKAGFAVTAFLIHADADTQNFAGRVAAIAAWFNKNALDKLGPALVACVPEPCTERWLCQAEGRTARRASPARGCDPWKTAWQPGNRPDLDRVRSAAGGARTSLTGLADFVAFYDSWKAAGLT